MTAARRLIGAHMPVSGGLQSAIISGADIGCNAVQVFTANPKQWQHPPLADDEVNAFRAACVDHGIGFTCAHDSYLINLAAPEPKVLGPSKRAFVRELERSEALGIPWVVTHMGAHLGTGEQEGLDRLIASLQGLLEDTAGMKAGVALETTAGQGTGLGYTLEQLAQVIDGVGDESRVGVCMDTCHMFAAGYEITDRASYDRMWEDFDRLIGLARLKLIHCNDAKKPAGSRVDRHEHLGQGQIGLEPFRWLAAEPALMHVPLIVETPEAETMHRENVRILREIAEGV